MGRLRPDEMDDFEGIPESVAEADALPAVDLTGWLLVWKPVGCTSFDLIRWCKAALRGVKPKPKLGHTGTLDPFAEGLVLIALGGATRLIPLLEDWDKTYAAVCALGTTTSTLDPTGQVIATAPVPSLDRAAVEGVLPRLIGQVWQTPPAYSALKQGGEALYKKARRGEEVEVPPRVVDIHALRLLDLPEPDRLALEITCGAGTYVRTLCADLAGALGTVGHCAELSRTALGPLSEDDAWRIAGPEEVTTEALQFHLQPSDWTLEALPFASLGCAEAEDFSHGRRLQVPALHELSTVAPMGHSVRVYAAEGHFLGVAICQSQAAPYVLQPQVVLSAAGGG